MNTFENFGLSQQTLDTIKRLGITQPTQIQELSLPHIMAGKDVIGESATGSGKTLAFGCGIIEHITPGNGLQAIVLTPTRELAEQVRNSLISFSRQKPMRIISVYGGVSINPQISELQRANVVVATPGRFLDHLKRRTINVSRVNMLVLDEADRMFDMGFIEDVEQIIRACPRERQTMFFSATLSPRVKKLARDYMVSPEEVSAVSFVDPSRLKQVYYDVQKNMKFPLLVSLLNKEQAGLVMVFCNTRRNTDFVSKNLRANGIDATAIHGGLSQNKRTRTIDMFNDAKVSVLVCTDVAARGLHIENVSHVYNYDIPKDTKDYVHRIGRTARAGEAGKAVNLLCNYDYDNFSNVMRDYRLFNIEKMEMFPLEKVNIAESGNRGRRPFHNNGRPTFGRRDFHRRRF